MNIKVLSVGLILFMSTGIFAQENKINFTLKEAQDFALLHNKTLQNAKSDLLIADEQIKETKGAGLPQLAGTMDYMTNFNYSFSFDFGGGGATEPPQIDYSLLDPGDYEVLNSINQMFGSSGGSEIIMEDQMNAKVQISQLIFSGQYWVGLQLAKIGKNIAEKNLSLTELDIRENVINTYYISLVTEELLKIVNENENNLKDILQHTTNMYEAGLAEQTDVDQIKVNLSQLANSKKVMERNLQLNYNMMRLVLGVEEQKEIVLSESLESVLQDLENDNLQGIDLNLTNNPAFQIMQAQENIGQKNVDLQKWAYGPTVSGFYSYTEKIMTSGFDLSPKNVAGVNMSIPIFEGGTKRAQVSKAKIELDKITRSKSLLAEQLVLQEKQLTFEKNSALENYNTQKENVEVAKRVLENINNKYKQGIISSLDLTQANSNYLQAENNYVTSVLQLLQSKLMLDKLYNNFQ